MKNLILLLSVAPLLASSSWSQGTRLYATDFTDLGGWTVTTGCAGPEWSWNADATPDWHSAGPYVSAPASLNFNNGVNIGGTTPFTGATTCGWATSDPIDLSLASGAPRLRFFASWDVEAHWVYDLFTLEIRSVADDELRFTTQFNTFVTTSWHAYDLPLDPAWGLVRLEFGFDSVDELNNTGTGAFVDDLEVVAVGTLFCFGDGEQVACPCGNESQPEERAGCAHSGGLGGKLRTLGHASVTSDTLVLSGSSMPDQSVLYFQANASQAAQPFGAGLRCTGGNIIHLGTKLNTSGASAYPGVGDPSISMIGSVSPSSMRHYSAWFRDTGGPCSTSGAFNLTNALTIVWEP